MTMPEPMAVRAPCSSESACVEASAVAEHSVFLRSSLAPDDQLHLTRGEWDAFRTAVKAGHFDTV
jgi:uncharacterized protein DUF397